MKLRVLVLGTEHFVAAKLLTALAAGDWAAPVPFQGPPTALSSRDLAGIHAVFNGAMGKPADILAHAQSLYGALARTGMDIRVVHLSSMTVYGSFIGDAVENTALRSDLGAYGAAQVQAELLASRYPRSIILRPGCEYGPGCPQWSERIARLLWARRLGDLGAAGDGVCNLLFIDDLIAAIDRCLWAPGLDGTCFNLAMRSAPTWNEYFNRFARVLGAVPIARVGRRRLALETKLYAPPLKVLELLARRMGGRSMHIPPAITPSLVALCGQNLTLNSHSAELALELSWTSLEEGLRQAVAALA